MCNIHEFTCRDSVLISFSFFFAVDVIVDSLEGHFNMMKFAFSSLCVDLTVSRRDRKYVVAAVRTATGEQGLTESMSAILVRRKVASKKKKKNINFYENWFGFGTVPMQQYGSARRATHKIIFKMDKNIYTEEE